MSQSYATLSLAELLRPEGFDCVCGRHHCAMPLREVLIKSGALLELPAVLSRAGICRPFIVCDVNTKKAAADRVTEILDNAGIPYTLFCLPMEHVEPDETALGSILMAFDGTADGFIAVGSGVISDLCKVASQATGRLQVTVATAPSMDGYASTCASMLIGGLKMSIYRHCPAAIIADIDILRNAPMRMLQAGLGDMITKYVSLMEWKMAGMINEEYYCPEAAEMVRRSALLCFEAAPGLANRDPDAVSKLIEGLILSAVGVAFVGISGPSSGAEHYISHIWDMQGIEQHRPPELHGIQTGVGTLRMLKVYEHLRGYVPDEQRALGYVRAFDWARWEKDVRRLYGRGAQKAIDTEKKAGKHDAAKHRARLARVFENWNELQQMICAMPDSETVAALWGQTGAPLTHLQIGHTDEELSEAFAYSPEIRDKYVGSRLIWDLGLMEEAKRWITEL